MLGHRNAGKTTYMALMYELMNAGYPRAHRGARRLTVLVQRAIKEQEVPTPLVLSYTKADLLTDDSQWDRALEPFPPLSDAMANSGNALATCRQRSRIAGRRGVRPGAAVPLSSSSSSRAAASARGSHPAVSASSVPSSFRPARHVGPYRRAGLS